MTGRENTSRNVELFRRRQAGERWTDLARDYNITPARVRQLVDREKRRAEWRMLHPNGVPREERTRRSPGRFVRVLDADAGLDLGGEWRPKK